jgi:hypothetical protein
MGLSDPHQTDYSRIRQDPNTVRAVGRDYDAMPDYDPSALPSYNAFRNDVNHQYDFMTNRMGINVQPVDYDPYPDVHHMVNDVANNRRLKVLSTAATGAHPYLPNEDNDKFRAVHDLFGHAATGRSFDRHGEQAAYLAHSQMFSPQALPALTTETKGQNSSLILNGQFPKQKVSLLPQQHWGQTPSGLSVPRAAHKTADLPEDPLDPGVPERSLLVDADDAYDQWDWFQHHKDHPPVPTPNDVTWYHATPADLPVGTVLAPHHGNPPWLDNPYHGGLDPRSNWTWVEYDTTHSDDWIGYMVRDHGVCYLYRVQPRLGPFPWNGTGKEGWVTDAATIVERLGEWRGGDGHVERVAGIGDEVFEHLRKSPGGVTFKHHPGDSENLSGYMVSPPHAEKKQDYATMTPADVDEYYDSHPEIRERGNYYGGWEEPREDPPGSDWYHDVPVNIQDSYDAAGAAAKWNQKAVFDNDKRDSKGKPLDSAYIYTGPFVSSGPASALGWTHAKRRAPRRARLDR